MLTVLVPPPPPPPLWNVHDLMHNPKTHFLKIGQFFFLIKKKINRRIIGLHNFLVFCHTSTRVSHRYTHVPSLWDLPPHPILQHVAEPLFEFPESYSKFPLAICFTYDIVNFYVAFSVHLPFSLLYSHLVHRSVLYVWFSSASLRINSSVPSLRFQIYVSVYNIHISLLTFFTLYNGL